MTVTKKLSKHGNSYALIIERAILELLDIDSNTLLEISTPDGASLVITPVRSKAMEKAFSSSLEEINKKYKKTLKKLAE